MYKNKKRDVHSHTFKRIKDITDVLKKANISDEKYDSADHAFFEGQLSSKFNYTYSFSVIQTKKFL